MISNQVLYQVCDFLSFWIGFQTAFGHHTESTWHLARASGVLGSKAVAQNPSIRDTLYVEMVAYLYPGTLLLPYLLEPFFIGLGQYQLCKWIIRSRRDIGIH